jgi:glucokinase
MGQGVIALGGGKGLGIGWVFLEQECRPVVENGGQINAKGDPRERVEILFLMEARGKETA